MVGADRDSQLVSVIEKNELHLAARVGTADLDFGRMTKQRGSHAVEDRRALGRLDADLLELLDVLLQRGLVAPGPAGDHELLDFQVFHATFFSPGDKGLSYESMRSSTTLWKCSQGASRKLWLRTMKDAPA